MNDPFLEILFIFLLLIANGVFAMSEIAMVSSRKARLQQKADDGDPAAVAAIELAETPNRFLSTVQIGITLIGILAGALSGATIAEWLAGLVATIPLLAPYSEGIALAVVVILLTYFTLVIGELIPKRLALNNPESVATAISRPMRLLSNLTSPLVRLLSASTELGLRILGIRPSTEPPVTEEEIKVLMEQGTQVGIFEEAEQDMVASVFRLSDRYIDAIMTPRTEIEWLDLDESPAEILAEVIRSKHSRFPAAHDNLDNVVGILPAKDFLSKMYAGQAFDIQTLLQPPLFVPDSMSALKVLEMIRAAGVHEALVLDEYGGLLGMVTLYDVLRAIVGELPGSGANGEPQIIQREDGSWLVDGLLSVDDLKELLDVEELPEEDRIGYQTVGGFIFNQLGSIPSAGQSLAWNDYRFEIIDMDGRRIDKVLVTRLPVQPQG
ncbi:MAG: hemolysin family protein [Bellilinea sp.]|jgi:putative hemolysin